MSMIQLGALAWMVVGIDNICRMVGIAQRPAWTYSVERNSMQFGILLFIILPQVVNQFTVSGAFELILDDEKEIFSKLNAGRFPTQEELISGLQAAGVKMASEGRAVSSVCGTALTCLGERESCDEILYRKKPLVASNACCGMSDGFVCCTAKDESSALTCLVANEELDTRNKWWMPLFFK
eukprot:scaffold34630_cov185-Amphora_coffeaeformis.AAC.8